MSYDLSFVGRTRPSPSDFFEHFASRDHYQRNANQAWYSNEDTGVYFAFEWTDDDESKESETEHEAGELETEEPDGWASFNLNLFRPGYFADEALIELEAFTSRFGPEVFDPQGPDAGVSLFVARTFRKSWGRSNLAGARALLAAEGSVRPETRPGDVLQRIWRWNLGRSRRQEQLGESVFVPAIGFFQTPEGLLSATVWPDAIPILIPKTDAIILYKGELAPRKWFRRRAGLSVVRWEDAAPLVQTHGNESPPGECWLLDHEERPEDIVAWFQSAPLTVELQPHPMDEVLDTEVVDAALEP